MLVACISHFAFAFLGVSGWCDLRMGNLNYGRNYGNIGRSGLRPLLLITDGFFGRVFFSRFSSVAARLRHYGRNFGRLYRITDRNYGPQATGSGAERWHENRKRGTKKREMLMAMASARTKKACSEFKPLVAALAPGCCCSQKGKAAEASSTSKLTPQSTTPQLL